MSAWMYLTLDRSAETPFAAKRSASAWQPGRLGPTGVMYILDDLDRPVISAHTSVCWCTLQAASRHWHTVIVVEHDDRPFSRPDYVLIRAGAGVHGGEIVAEVRRGNPGESRFDHGAVPQCKTEVALPRLRTHRAHRTNRSASGGRPATTCGMSQPNPARPCSHASRCLRAPAKSTLIIDTLFGYATAKLNGSVLEASPCERVEGLEQIDRVIDIDQSPIGRTPVPTRLPTTDCLRRCAEIFAAVPEARARGYDAGRFAST